jgi:hypothetical protein
MGYYVRAFCGKGEVPTIQQILDWVKDRGCILNLLDKTEVDVNSSDWLQFEVEYKSGNKPIIVECTRDDGCEGCLFREEVNDFLESIDSPDLPSSKLKVIEHLKSSKFTIVNQLLSDLDDDGFNANGHILSFFINNNDAIIQADGEGFYEGEKLILPME